MRDANTAVAGIDVAEQSAANDFESCSRVSKKFPTFRARNH